MNQPNILWICTDQQRYDTLGCAGNQFINTPNLDNLAQNGVMFDNCFSQSPVCAPSRAAFLTGRYPVTCGCRQNGQDIPATEVPVTKLLTDNGYRCGLSGKLHISACNPALGIEMEPRINDGYTDFHWSHHDGAGWDTHNEYWQWLDEHGLEFKETPHPECKYISYGMQEEYTQSGWCVDKAIDFIKARQDDGQPWLFSVNIFDPHHSFNPPKSALDKFADIIDDIPLPEYVPGELENKPVWQQTDHKGAYSNPGQLEYETMSESDHRWIKAAYWAMVEIIDRHVGRLLETLKATGMDDNTIIIFSSDHGEMLGDHGIYLKGPYFYDCLTRVPLILSGKGLCKDRRVAELTELFDIAPTILDLCGIDIPEGMQAKSFKGILNGSELTHRDSVYCEFYGANFTYTPHAFTTMVRTDQYKLTVAHRLNQGELYDLQKDPSEHNNLWNDPNYSAIKTDMLMLLTDRMAETADPLPHRKAMW